MEVPKHRQGSFQDQTDLYLLDPTPGSGVLQNSFKPMFDLEEPENFISLYMNHRPQLISNDHPVADAMADVYLQDLFDSQAALVAKYEEYLENKQSERASSRKGSVSSKGRSSRKSSEKISRKSSKDSSKKSSRKSSRKASEDSARKSHSSRKSSAKASVSRGRSHSKSSKKSSSRKSSKQSSRKSSKHSHGAASEPKQRSRASSKTSHKEEASRRSSKHSIVQPSEERVASRHSSRKSSKHSDRKASKEKSPSRHSSRKSSKHSVKQSTKRSRSSSKHSDRKASKERSPSRHSSRKSSKHSVKQSTKRSKSRSRSSSKHSDRKASKERSLSRHSSRRSSKEQEEQRQEFQQLNRERTRSLSRGSSSHLDKSISHHSRRSSRKGTEEIQRQQNNDIAVEEERDQGEAQSNYFEIREAHAEKAGRYNKNQLSESQKFEKMRASQEKKKGVQTPDSNTSSHKMQPKFNGDRRGTNQSHGKAPITSPQQEKRKLVQSPDTRKSGERQPQAPREDKRKMLNGQPAHNRSPKTVKQHYKHDQGHIPNSQQQKPDHAGHNKAALPSIRKKATPKYSQHDAATNSSRRAQSQQSNQKPDNHLIDSHKPHNLSPSNKEAGGVNRSKMQANKYEKRHSDQLQQESFPAASQKGMERIYNSAKRANPRIVNPKGTNNSASTHSPDKGNGDPHYHYARKYDNIKGTLPEEVQSNAKKAIQKRKEIMEQQNPYNPYNAYWTKQILKNHFDVELEATKSKEPSSKTQWKIRKIRNPKREEMKNKERSGETDFSHLLDRVYGNQSTGHEQVKQVNKAGRRTDGFNQGKNTRSHPEKRSQTQNAQLRPTKFSDNQIIINNFLKDGDEYNFIAKLPIRSRDFGNFIGPGNDEDGYNANVPQPLPIYHPNFIKNIQKHNFSGLMGTFPQKGNFVPEFNLE